MVTHLETVFENSGRPLPLWFEITPFQESTQISPDINTPKVEDDKEITTFTSSTTGEQVTLVVSTSYVVNGSFVVYTFESDNPTKIDINEFGVITFQVIPEETASAIITVTGTSGVDVITRTVSVTLTVSGAKAIDVIDGGVAGSARKALSDPIDNALNGANPATQRDVYTTQAHSTPAYVRNTSFFLNSHVEALTCASPWNSRQGKNRAGTAVTKRHAVVAYHYPLAVNDTLRFIASNNTVVTRSVLQVGRIFQNGAGTDILMVLLDSDLPASITPCKLFPSGYSDYLPAGAASGSYAATDIPLLALDQEERGVVLDFLKHGYPPEEAHVLFDKPKLADRIAFWEQIITGDSGNPIFAAIGSELWLLSTFYGSYVGPFYGELSDELNAMITELDTLQGDITGYTVTEGDLSSYTTYP